MNKSIKRPLFVLCFSLPSILFTINTVIAQKAIVDIPDWENPKMFDRNKEKPRATFIPFNDIESSPNPEKRAINFLQDS
ncbi:MAG: hypothetical protein MZV64_29940 [Ignavibacteriales bacterium]|nr:hypothetical protein [Ignavibacteriales bacterium]